MGSNPRISPDGLRIIFSSPRTGHGDIYVMNIDGSKQRRLTSMPDYEGEASYSPDGSKICYVREEEGQGKIFVMDSDGRNQKKITSDTLYDSSPVFCSDNKRIVFKRRLRLYQSEIYIVNLDGTKTRRISHNTFTEEVPVFSADCNSIYYFVAVGDPFRIDRKEARKIDIITGKEKILFSIPPRAEDIQWSANLESIVFLSNAPKHKTFQLYTMKIDERLIRQIGNIDFFLSYPSFSFDGSKLLFLSEPNRDGKGIIFLMNNDGSNLREIGKNY